MGSGLELFFNADSLNIAEEDVSNSLQDMTLHASKFTNTAFILHDVLSDHGKMFIKNIKH